jgi:hypothetical protein
MNAKDKDAGAVGPTKVMSNQDLAGFVAMLFWMNDPSAAAYTPYASFQDQVAGIQAALKNGNLPATTLIQNIQTISQDPTIGPLLQTAQQSIGVATQAIIQAGLWDVCKSVSMNQVARIATL